MPDLEELGEVLQPTRGPATPREDVETAIQALLFHQVLYEDSRGAKRSYDVLRRHRGFFDRYFSAMGHRLVVNSREAMVALLPGQNSYAWRETRLSKDETLVLLALRFVLEAGVRQGRLTESGRVESTTDDLHNAIRTLAQAEPPQEGRMNEILAGFRRRGLVRIEPRDMVERVTPITVLPGVRLVCTDEFAGHLVAWAEAAEAERGQEDVLGFISARRGAGMQAGPPGAPDPSGQAADGGWEE